MSFLIVAAHPDDEVLGAGGTIHILARQQKEVSVCILSGKADARAYRPSDQELAVDTGKCLALLGVKRQISGDFPNIQFNTVPHLELVQFIEQAIMDTGADTVFTHHPADLNNDHVHTSFACQAAVRLFQRKSGMKPFRELLYMEVPSATEWGMDSSSRGFCPNTFVEIGKEGIHKKIEALSMYRGVMREYPHPRSREALTGLAAWRGSQSGSSYAEAFESAFRRI